jgi:outer membrane protein assembly factor BamD
VLNQPLETPCHKRRSPTLSVRGATRIGLLIIACAHLGACSWMPFFGKEKDVEQIETTEQKVYRDAQRLLRSGNYQQAIAQLELLEARFPFGRYAEQAQLELIYARFMSYDLDGAVSAADRFIRLHPQHSNIDYAFYIKGRAGERQNEGLMDRLFNTEPAKRDMAPIRQAYADFGQLLAQYPNSQYAADATQRMIHLRNVLARSEIAAADYYMQRAALIAAANRARFVLEVYPRSESTPDALLILIEANYRLGLEDEANNALRVLSLNYPKHPGFDESGNLVLTNAVRNRDRSWANVMTLGLLDRPEVPPPMTISHPEGFKPPQVEEQPSSADEKKGSRFGWLPFID